MKQLTKEKLEKDIGYSGMDVTMLYNPKVNRTKNYKDMER